MTTEYVMTCECQGAAMPEPPAMVELCPTCSGARAATPSILIQDIRHAVTLHHGPPSEQGDHVTIEFGMAIFRRNNGDPFMWMPERVYEEIRTAGGVPTALGRKTQEPNT